MFEHLFGQPAGMGRDHFSGLIDEQFRGRTVASAARRCQLYADHDGAHAYGWREKAAQRPRRGRPLPPFHVLRWDDSGAWPDESDERLRWCALESD
jgi:hypothetical protein